MTKYRNENRLNTQQNFERAKAKKEAAYIAPSQELFANKLKKAKKLYG